MTSVTILNQMFRKMLQIIKYRFRFRSRFFFFKFLFKEDDFDEFSKCSFSIRSQLILSLMHHNAQLAKLTIKIMLC